MCVSVFVGVCACVCACTSVCVHVYVPAYVCVGLRACMHVKECAVLVCGWASTLNPGQFRCNTPFISSLPSFLLDYYHEDTGV